MAVSTVCGSVGVQLGAQGGRGHARGSCWNGSLNGIGSRPRDLMAAASGFMNGGMASTAVHAYGHDTREIPWCGGHSTASLSWPTRRRGRTIGGVLGEVNARLHSLLLDVHLPQQVLRRRRPTAHVSALNRSGGGTMTHMPTLFHVVSLDDPL